MNNTIKIFKVDECFQCPHILSGMNYETNLRDHDCEKKERKIKDPFKIPKWCPLEDYKEGYDCGVEDESGRIVESLLNLEFIVELSETTRHGASNSDIMQIIADRIAKR